MTSMGWSGPRFALALIVVALFVGPRLHAEPARSEANPAIAAEALFEEARHEMAKGQYATACPKLEESQRLAPAPGTAFNLADCYEHIGRGASAWSLFRDVQGQTEAAGQHARAQEAGRRAAALEPTLPRIRIEIVETSDRLEVRRDGVIVGRSQWSVEIPVDLGEHVIVVSAPGKQPWKTSLNVARPAEVLVVTIPTLNEAAGTGVHAQVSPRPPTASASAEAPGAIAPPPSPPPGADLSRPPVTHGRTPAVVLGTAGLGLLAASGVTVAIARSIWNDAGPCTGSVCQTQQAVDQRARARTWGDVATGLGIAGSVSAGAGLVLWLLEPNDAARSASMRRRWDVAVGTNGMEFRRSW